jgi:hypothetical protein
MKYYLADNQRYSLLQFFQDNASKYNNLCIATGYLDLEAFCLILPLINNYQSIKILIGQEPLIRRYKKDNVEEDFPALDLTDDLQQLEINPKYADTINNIKTLIKTDKLQIKIYKKTFLHAKCYIFAKHNEKGKSDNAIGIIGSSNFTANGISSNKNIELNHLEHDERVVTYPEDKDKPNLIGHYAWFNQLWNDGYSENWTGSFSEILDLSPVGEVMFSPYEMYIKTLWEIYKEDIEITGDQVLDGEMNFKLHEFQLKNANSICKRLDKRKLAMLCDSVGLGKTITALEVIARYIKADKRVVVICPKSLKDQWEHAVRRQGLNTRLDIISLQNEAELNKHIEFDKYAPVGLFVIDESHNLRTGSSSSRFERVRGWIRDNNNSHCLMLTATPINNSITDLLNQILVGSGGDANILQIPTSDGKGMRNVVDIINSMKRSEGHYDELTSESMSKRRAKLHPILKEFVIRRTRYGILKEQEVSNFEKKLEFPQEQLQIKSYDFSHSITKQIILNSANFGHYDAA